MAILQLLAFVVILAGTLIVSFVLPIRAASWVDQRFGAKETSGEKKARNPCWLACFVLAGGTGLLYVSGFMAAAVVLAPGPSIGGILYTAAWLAAVATAAASC